MPDVIRRKIDRARQPLAEGTPGADRGWRLALARAARDLTRLEVEFLDLAVSRVSLAEVLDLAPERALVALLDGPGGGLGVLFMSPAITSALIEMLTMGRLAPQASALRKPTRIDAAMVAGLIDRALQGLEENLAEEADLAWAGGFRYASHLEDVRPLSLVLEDEPYRLLAADLSCGRGARAGKVILVLPAQGRGLSPLADPVADSAPPQFTAAFADQVLQAGAWLDAVIGRLRLPLGRIMALQPGETLVLQAAALDAIALETLEGRGVGLARLGQNRGMRALKLAAPDRDQRPVSLAVQPSVASPVTPGTDPGGELRAAG